MTSLNILEDQKSFNMKTNEILLCDRGVDTQHIY